MFKWTWTCKKVCLSTFSVFFLNRLNIFVSFLMNCVIHIYIFKYMNTDFILTSLFFHSSYTKCFIVNAKLLLFYTVTKIKWISNIILTHTHTCIRIRACLLNIKNGRKSYKCRYLKVGWFKLRTASHQGILK